MKVLKAVFTFYINASIHVATAVTALVGLTDLYLQLSLKSVFYAFVFLGTITAYNFVKYAKVAGLHHRSLTRRLKAIQIFSALCGIALVILSIKLPLKVILYTLGLGLYTFLYAVPIIAGYNLRSLGGVKAFVVAFVWTGMTVIVPVIASETFFSSTIVILCIQRFLLVIIWLLPFEIRDVKYDNLSLGTLPQRLGLNRTKALGVLLLVIVMFLEIELSSHQLWKISAVIITLLVSGVLLVRSKKKQSAYYASFWVESIPIFWFLLLYFFFHFSS